MKLSPFSIYIFKNACILAVVTKSFPGLSKSCGYSKCHRLATEKDQEYNRSLPCFFKPKNQKPKACGCKTAKGVGGGGGRNR
jgi:hypothetical protein